MIRQQSVIICVFILSVVLGSCKKKEDEAVSPIGNPADHKAMLTNMADSIVIPGYAGFKVKLDDMRSKSDAFRLTPSTTTLTAFRQAWKDAYIEWQKIELYDFGPASDNNLRKYMNIYPINISAIDQNIVNGNADLNDATFPTQGFPALDYLINGVGATDDDIVAYYSAPEPDADKRTAYLMKLTDQMNTKILQVQTDWISYRDAFVSHTGIDRTSPLSLVMNGILNHYEKYIRSGKIGIPAGVTGGVRLPEYVEAYYKQDLSKTLVKTAHQAFVDFFNGKSFNKGIEGPSFKTYLSSVDAKALADILNAQFNVSANKLNLLSDNLSYDVEQNNAAMINAYNELQRIVPVMKVDMASAMGITIDIEDGDGD